MSLMSLIIPEHFCFTLLIDLYAALGMAEILLKPPLSIILL